jgi:hypothetical protein
MVDEASITESMAAWMSQMMILLAKVQCGGGSGDYPACKVDSPTGYGYLQVEDYARKQKRRRVRGTGLGPKRWISLPRNIEVLSSPNQDSTSCKRLAAGAQPLRSCLRRDTQECKKEASKDPVSLEKNCKGPSAVASQERRRRVSFCDHQGSVANSSGANGVSTPLAKWIFVDRDICGFSLYAYDATDAHLYTYEYFSSSPYGRSFQEELAKLHAIQAKDAADDIRDEAYSQEEQDLDAALKEAGVDELLLQHPEDYLLG